MHQSVYHSRDLQAWEQRWFAQQNSSYGLMQQAAWLITQRLISSFSPNKNNKKNIAVCCGQGNNAGDGYLIAKYLFQAGFNIDIYSSERGQSQSLNSAYHEALECMNLSPQNNSSYQLNIFEGFDFKKQYDVYIDALFGIGLNRHLNENWQNIIQSINHQDGLKISIDIPSGLCSNSGQTLPCAIRADTTYSILALKAGLFTGKGKEYAGKIENIALIPMDTELKAVAQISSQFVYLPKRQAFGHKGTYGHVLIVGGHADMGGAVIMAAESAFYAGAGKVTIVCDVKHHMAILARSPNIMLKDINQLQDKDIDKLVNEVDAVSLGMGLGRDQWAEQHYLQWMNHLNQSNVELVLDADALWFLAKYPLQVDSKTYLTPHPGEAATLLACSVQEIESDRINAIHRLKEKYSGEWVLKGSGSLTLQRGQNENELWICAIGNAGMGTGGMGDVLAGMIASLKAQFHDQVELQHIVLLHALAGDYLAQNGIRGLQAHHMNEAIYKVVNLIE